MKLHKDDIHELVVGDSTVLLSTVYAQLTDLRSFTLKNGIHRFQSLAEQVPPGDDDGNNDGRGHKNASGNLTDGNTDHANNQNGGGSLGSQSDLHNDDGGSVLDDEGRGDEADAAVKIQSGTDKDGDRMSEATSVESQREILFPASALKYADYNYTPVLMLLSSLDVGSHESRPSTTRILPIYGHPSTLFRPPILHPAGENSLRETFSKLPSLRHIKTGYLADDFLLTNLASFFFCLESFVHSDTVCFGAAKLYSMCHQALKRLAFKESINMSRLRAVAAAFPVLTQLTITRFEWDDWYTVKHRDDDTTDYQDLDAAVIDAVRYETLECSFLESLVVSDRNHDYSGFLGSGFRFPKITRIDGGFEISSANQI
ncbi:hypothetical protein BGW39_001316 [Mortierella sp. 14UC]|nr:hypothetical protein BGW39_001316 [Mortierella sp. 14UC]